MWRKEIATHATLVSAPSAFELRTFEHPRNLPGEGGSRCHHKNSLRRLSQLQNHGTCQRANRWNRSAADRLAEHEASERMDSRQAHRIRTGECPSLALAALWSRLGQ